MGSLNQVTLIGNLGRDAELKYTSGGTPVSTINMATTETWKDKQGQKKEQTEWHRVVLWGPTAENLQEYLTKGKSICVVGKLQTRKWTDKNGVERYTTEIKADRVTLLGGATAAQNSGGKKTAQTEADPDSGGGDFDPDDIPF
jgi:single-strand DNA-binding protein